MFNFKHVLYVLLLLSIKNMFSQTIEIQGKVESFVNVENIHIINKNGKDNAVTNKLGEFKIKAKLNDTLVFSSIQHFKKSVVIDKNIIISKVIKVTLKEKVNDLDQVVVGKVLSGNLYQDIKAVEGTPTINFYDVGIPGYTGKKATQSERKLAQAGEFKPEMLLGIVLGGGSLDPIINGISGRTKMLKNRVKQDETEELLQTIKSRLSKDFLASNPLEEDLVADFFYFCSDDENFIKRCKNQTDFNILVFLRMKYKQYKININLSKD